MKVTTMGIDLAKDIFRVHGCDARGRAVLSKSLTRHELRVFMAKLPPCQVGMEACHTAHYWAQELQQFGHQVKLMAPRFIRPYVKNNKNDTRDAEAICEAVTRPTMRFVPIKSRAQLDVQAVHRVRQQVVRERAALANQLRGFLAEHGIVIRKGFFSVRRALPDIIEDRDNGLSGLMRDLMSDLYERFKLAEQRLHRYDERVTKLVEQDERCQRLAKLRGRSAYGHRGGGFGRQRTPVQKRTRAGGVFRTGSAPSRKRQPYGHAPDRATLRSLSKDADVSGGAGLAALHRTSAGYAQRLGQSSQVEAPHQAGGGQKVGIHFAASTIVPSERISSNC
jgi:Transposase